MWRTKANKVSTRDWLCIPLLLWFTSAACHILQRNYGMKLFRVHVYSAHASQPIPFPIFSLWHYYVPFTGQSQQTRAPLFKWRDQPCMRALGTGVVRGMCQHHPQGHWGITESTSSAYKICFQNFACCYGLATVIPCESVSVVVACISTVIGEGWCTVSAGM